MNNFSPKFVFLFAALADIVLVSVSGVDDLENKQISATRTPKMKPESNKRLRRTSKTGPMSRQWRHLGNRRHLRRQKRPQQGPMERPNGAPDADWRRKGSKHGSNRTPKRCQKRVEIRNPREVENRTPAAAGAQFSA